jgi:hypothetical protein
LGEGCSGDASRDSIESGALSFASGEKYLFRATTITGRGHTVEALPTEKTTEILKKYGAIK